MTNPVGDINAPPMCERCHEPAIFLPRGPSGRREHICASCILSFDFTEGQASSGGTAGAENSTPLPSAPADNSRATKNITTLRVAFSSDIHAHSSSSE